MKLTLNGEYAKRHLFVVLLMAGLGCWFGYDGLVAYPAQPAADLYRSIEKSDPREGMDLEAFKRQKIQTQYGFMGLSLLMSAIVGFRLWKASRVDFSFDDQEFVWAGRRYPRTAIVSVDRSRWESKSILVLKLEDGAVVTLDAWHHLGVKEFAATV